MKLKLDWVTSAWDDHLYWQTQDKNFKAHQQSYFRVLRTPFEDTGKPGPLKANLTGFWSRCIDEKHHW